MAGRANGFLGRMRTNAKAHFRDLAIPTSIGLAVLAAGAALNHYAWQPPVDHSSLLFTVGIFAAILAVGGAIFAALGVAAFGWGVLTRSGGNDPLQLVSEQKTYNTGSFATDEQIHSALSGGIVDDAANRMTFDE